jgi:hypothetical protein
MKALNANAIVATVNLPMHGLKKRANIMKLATVIASFLVVGAFSSPAQAQTHEWLVSYGGNSNFQKLAVGPAIDGLRFGDFNGDGKTDVFATTPNSDSSYTWLVSYGGNSNFQKLAVGPAIDGLRFGDFNGDGKTDVFATIAFRFEL